eukprot:GHVR01001206.1.p2 GENE.GHVR01001206.1~~GHVR01001206.1.p2  ORF type:complete len:102 (-),score=16.79 GHVR01001206.1:168-473(-)
MLMLVSSVWQLLGVAMSKSNVSCVVANENDNDSSYTLSVVSRGGIGDSVSWVVSRGVMGDNPCRAVSSSGVVSIGVMGDNSIHLGKYWGWGELLLLIFRNI